MYLKGNKEISHVKTWLDILSSNLVGGDYRMIIQVGRQKGREIEQGHQVRTPCLLESHLEDKY